MLSVLAITGCYNPKVQSGGFACSTTDNPPCPSGFFCVNGLCLDHQGGGGSAGGGGGAVDMAMTSSGGDMSMPSGGDMATGPGDMAHQSTDMACFAFTYQCNSDPTCCAQCCAGGCAAVGWCAAF